MYDLETIKYSFVFSVSSLQVNLFYFFLIYEEVKKGTLAS